MSLESAIADQTTAVTALTQSVHNKMGSIEAHVQQKINELEAWRVASVGKLPTINLLRDAGRFFDIDAEGNSGNRRSIKLAAPFATLAMGVYSTKVASAGKFIYDSSTNGGVQGALTQSVIDLLAAKGTPGARYGQEFYVAEMTVGEESVMPMTVEGRTLTLACSISVTATGWLTFMSWLRCIAGSVHVDVVTHKNGQPLQSHLLQPGDNWAHLAGSINWGNGYSVVHIRCEQNSKFQMALPAMLLGDSVGQMHTAPLPSFEY